MAGGSVQGARALFSLEDIFLPLLGNLGDKFREPWEVNGALEQLSRIVPHIPGILVDAEDERQSGNNFMNYLFEEFRAVAYEAEDIVDLSETRKLLRATEAEHPAPLFKKVCRRLTFSNLIDVFYSRPKTWSRIKKICDYLEKLQDHGYPLNRGPRIVTMSRRALRPTGSLVAQSNICGRDADKQNVMDLVLLPVINQGGVQAHLSVVALVGGLGFGKRSLAKLVYDEVPFFDKKIWVGVCEEFNVVRVVRSIIELLDETRCELSDMNLLKLRLKELLTGKTYLLVLEDVSHENSWRWGVLEEILRECGIPGSKVMVIARSPEVLHAMRIKYQYTLGRLGHDDCWRLFLQLVFADGDAENFPKLVPIGNEIVSKCEGVLLAVKALGTLLFPCREECRWLDIKDTRFFDLNTEVLKLSYDRLPSYLKYCFAYCSVYPKGYKINVKALIQQWIAHKFIHQSRGRPLEDIGYEYFNDLSWRFFFQVVTKDEFGDWQDFKMHHLVHDLAQSVGKDEYLIITKGISDSDSLPLRHITVLGEVPKDVYKQGGLRTFVGGDISNVVLNQLVSSLKHLRVLDLSWASNIELPNSICNLILLRYLYLGSVKDDILPDSVCNLLNLQALHILRGVRQLPSNTCQLTRLRHLGYGDIVELECMPTMIGRLTNLRTLGVFVVTKDEGCGIDQLGGLDGLGGSLTINKLENVGNVVEATQAKLNNKQYLRHWNLVWSKDAVADNVEEVLTNLVPHQNVKSLSINFYPGCYFPRWLMDHHCNLVKLELSNCNGCEDIRLLCFPSLVNVCIRYMKNAKQLDFSLDGCPCLKTLDVISMNMLEVLLQVGTDQLFPHFQKLSISNCPILCSVQLARSFNLETLSISNCPKVQTPLS